MIVTNEATVIEREAVRAILLTPKNEVLLLRIRLSDAAECFWIAPGGGLEPGETIEEGLKRELREELGLDEYLIGPLVWRRQHTFSWGANASVSASSTTLFKLIALSRKCPTLTSPRFWIDFVGGLLRSLLMRTNA